LSGNTPSSNPQFSFQDGPFSTIGRGLQWRARKARKVWIDWRLARLRKKVWAYGPDSVVRFLGYTVRITDGPNFYMQYKDEFVRQIYHFKARRPDPLIIDGGSNIGMSILYFKRIYPSARVIGFEPDPSIFRILEGNMNRNNIEGVNLINAGLGAESGSASFVPDGSAGGQVMERCQGITITLERLSDYLDEPVDFLKLNVEGAELGVLEEAEASNKIRNIDELVLEYHGCGGKEQRLGPILDLLDRTGFRYLVHDFDEETNGASKPPFHLEPTTTWFCLVYARRLASGVDSAGPKEQDGS
jgi:FkbM family methyltransferase